MECETKSEKTEKKTAWKLMLENARISIWLLIIVIAVLGGLDKINSEDLTYLLGFIAILSVGGENAIEYLAQRLHFKNDLQKKVATENIITRVEEEKRNTELDNLNKKVNQMLKIVSP